MVVSRSVILSRNHPKTPPILTPIFCGTRNSHTIRLWMNSGAVEKLPWFPWPFVNKWTNLNSLFVAVKWRALFGHLQIHGKLIPRMIVNCCRLLILGIWVTVRLIHCLDLLFLSYPNPINVRCFARLQIRQFLISPMPFQIWINYNSDLAIHWSGLYFL